MSTFRRFLGPRKLYLDEIGSALRFTPRNLLSVLSFVSVYSVSPWFIPTTLLKGFHLLPHPLPGVSDSLDVAPIGV